jgi:cell division protein FtsI/penicillin-binding protein 2
LIGFVGSENVGLEALEKQYNDVLMSLDENNQPQNFFGNDIYLTIDKQIQQIVRENLIKGVNDYSAKGGVGIVYNPINSEILAMCSIPDYDPYTRRPTPFSALAEAVEPGSVFKVFSSSLLFENDLITFQTKTDCGTPVDINGRIIHPNTNHNILEFKNVFKYSSNVGIIRNTMKIDDRDFYPGILEYGFGKKTGIDFPIESAGIFKPEEKIGSEQSKAMISIGYEISVTPLQLTVALGSIVNGGAVTTPLLVSEVRNSKGELVEKINPSIKGLSPAKEKTVSKAMIELMRGVVKRGGTGKEADIKGIDIIGKTGTAQRLSQDGTYDEGKVNTIFFGVVKFYNDPIVILVLIEDPISEKWASRTAAPVFKSIVNEMIDYGLIYEY